MEQYQNLERIWQACRARARACVCVVAVEESAHFLSLLFLLSFQYSLLFHPYIHLPLCIPSGSFLPPLAFCYHGRLKVVISVYPTHLRERSGWLASHQAGVIHTVYIFSPEVPILGQHTGSLHCIIYHLNTCLSIWIIKCVGLSMTRAWKHSRQDTNMRQDT